MLDEQKLIFSRQCSQGMMSTQQKLHQVNNKQKLPWPFWSAFSDFKSLQLQKTKKKKKKEGKNIEVYYGFLLWSSDFENQWI